jgi:hypothetical protein
MSTSVTAMGGSQPNFTYIDSSFSGTVTEQNETDSFTIESQSPRNLRIAVARTAGTTTLIINTGHGAIINADTSVTWLNPMNTVDRYHDYVPAFSICSQYANTTYGVTPNGTDQVNGAPVNVVIVTPPTDSTFNLQPQPTYVYINQNTNYVDKLKWTNESEDGTYQQVVEVYYSQYTNVSGVAVPFQQITYVDGVLDSTLQISSFAFNVGVPSSDFTLPQ